jgi:hypothetical protein
VHLVLFGWISAMIYAVSYHTMPVFTARDFPFPRLAWVQLGAFACGLAAATGGMLWGARAVLVIGLLLEAGAALLFVANTMLLVTRGRWRAAGPPPAPIPDQAPVDRVGTRATRSASLCLPMSLLLLLMARIYDAEAWTLAAEHLAALGWVLLMIVGVAYHVLPRFSGRCTRGARWARVQLRLHQGALALMVPALGLDWAPLFALGALAMSAALGLFAWTIWPTLRPLAARPMPNVIALQEQPR